MTTGNLANLPPVIQAHTPRAVHPYAPGLEGRQAAFSEALGRQLVPSASPSADPGERARAGAEQLVATAFVQPLLKQLRESDHSAPPFAPTQAEKQLRAMGDTELAHRIVHASHFPVVDRIAQDLLKRGGKDALGRKVKEQTDSARAAAAPDVPGATIAAPAPRSSLR